MIPQSDTRESGEGEATELARRVLDETTSRSNGEATRRPTGEHTVRALESRAIAVSREPEWKAVQKAALLLGSAALVLPTALTLLILGAILPVDRAEMFVLLLASSALFLVVVQLAWKAHESLPRTLVPRLHDQFDRDLHGPSSLVQ